MAFPSTISTFNVVSGSDRLNSPSHSALHNSVSSVLTQVQTVIGTDASVIGTIIGDLRNANSNGGGHIQTANKGGTGQTSFTKGDLLVATSSSVIAKLGVSSVVGEALVADPSQAAGMKWAPVLGTKIALTTQTSSIYNSNTEHVLFSASIAGSTLGTNNGIKFKGVMRYDNSQTSFTVRTKFGNNTANTIVVPAVGANFNSMFGYIEGTIVGHTSVTSQKTFTEFYATNPGGDFLGGATVGYSKTGGMNFGTTSVNSSTNQDLIITGQFGSADPTTSILTQFFVVEKIV